MAAESNYVPSTEAIYAQLDRINKRSPIGRSKNYRKLLEYLIDKELSYTNSDDSARKTPKETEIAIDVFGKDSNFNPGDDATVRVHISNLRKKLEVYYKEESNEETFTITIPTGGYRIVFTHTGNTENPVILAPENITEIHETKTNETNQPVSRITILLSLALITVIVHLALVFGVNQTESNPTTNPLTEHKIWRDLNETGKPTVVVIGEKYTPLLDQLDPSTLTAPLTIADQEKHISKGSAIAFKNILSLFNYNQNILFRLSSDLTANDVRHFNIIYIGSLQSLGILNSYFDGSNFTLNRKDLSLNEKDGATSYVAPRNVDVNQQYSDYGIFAKINGPRAQKIYIVSGFTDSAILQISWFFTRPSLAKSKKFDELLDKFHIDDTNNFELLFKVNSLDGLDLNHEVISGHKVDAKAIWK